MNQKGWTAKITKKASNPGTMEGLKPQEKIEKF